MHKDQADNFSRVFHSILNVIHIERPSYWSEKLNGLTTIEFYILRFTAEHPDMVLKDFRDYYKIPHTTLTGVINRLEKKKLVQRIINKRDHRSFGLELTEKGKIIEQEHYNVDIMVSKKVLDTLDSEEEKETLIKLLEKIVSRIDK